MLFLWGLLFLTSFFLYLSERLKDFAILWDDKYLKRVKGQNSFIVLFIFLLLACFAGLRTSFNDTATYKHNFFYRIPKDFSSFSWQDLSLGDNPGFVIIQIFIKMFISLDPQIFILITSFLSVGLFIFFYNQYSSKFSLSIYLYITSGLFIFGMAAMKQTIAMAIGLLAIHYLVKKKLKVFYIIILFAATVHPYILLFLMLPFFSKDVWTKKIIWLLIFSVGVGFFFDYFISILLSITESIGEEYKAEYFSGEGVNRFRILVFSVTPILSFIFRKNINDRQDMLLNISVNASIISFLFMIMGSNGSANMFARMAIYFEPFIYISLPWILTKCMGKYKLIIIFTCTFFYGLFFYYQYGIVKPFIYKSVFL